MNEDDPQVLVKQHAVVAQRLWDMEERRQEETVPQQDDGLLGQEVACREQHQDHKVQAPAVLGNGVCNHRSDDEDNDHRRYRHNQSVEVRLREGRCGLAPDFDEVVEGETLRNGENTIVGHVRVGAYSLVDSHEERDQPDEGERDQEGIEAQSTSSDQAAPRFHGGRRPGTTCGGHCSSPRVVTVRKPTIGTSETTARITAIAAPKPMRSDSLMELLVISVDNNSNGLRPPFVMYARSNARRASIVVITTMTMLMGFITGNTTRKKVWRALAPSKAAASRSAGSKLFRPAR